MSALLRLQNRTLALQAQTDSKLFDMSKFKINRDALKASSYRDFLLNILRCGEATLPRGHLSLFARNTKMPRSFFTELFKGKKRLSSRALSKVINSLKISGEEARYLTLLAAAEEPKIRELHFRISESEIIEKVDILRQRLLQKKKFDPKFKPNSEKKILSYDLISTYAALGSIENGANFSEILFRSKLAPSILQNTLSTLVEAKWAEKTSDRYYASARALDFTDIGNDIGFRYAFTEACKQMIKKIDFIATQETSLVFFTAMPINPNRQLELKEKIRTAVLDILDEYQDDDGLMVKKIMVGVY